MNTVEKIQAEHNAAVEALSPQQKAAVNRIVVASMIAHQALIEAMGETEVVASEVQREASQIALAAVMREETERGPVSAAMWTELVAND